MPESATNVVREPHPQEPQSHTGYPSPSAHPTSALAGHAPAQATEGGDEPAPSLAFPVDWLLDHAAPPIQYRTCVDVMRLPADEGLSILPYASETALRIAVTQSLDGTWNERMLTLPRSRSSVQGLGTIPAVRRLLEYGWDRESPALAMARRPLFRLLAEDTDPHFSYELRGSSSHPEETVRGRQILREAAAATLAQAGYESDPRLRGAARRILERVDAYLESALSDKPWVRVGNQHVLSEGAAPPSVYVLTMLAYMPIFRSEHSPEMERLTAYLMQPKPAQAAVQLYGKSIINQPHLVMGDLLHNRNVADNDVPFALFWLETMARLGILSRNENWTKLFERLADQRDSHGTWHPRKAVAAPVSDSPYVWPIFPLEEKLEGDARWTDVTFRIGPIARLHGWEINPV